jgi:hypothetical protein
MKKNKKIEKTEIMMTIRVVYTYQLQTLNKWIIIDHQI